MAWSTDGIWSGAAGGGGGGTFGDTSTEASEFWSGYTDKMIIGCKFTAPANGTLTKISAYIYSAVGAQDFKAGLYSDNAGVPNALLAGSAAVNHDTTPAWVDFTVSHALVAGTVYWLAVMNCGVQQFIIRYHAGAVSQTARAYVGATALPDPFPGILLTFWDYECSIYGTYV